MPLIGTPSASYTSPSAWNPGASSVKPGSMTASTRRPAHSGGTLPSSRNHQVDHGLPQSVPVVNGS